MLETRSERAATFWLLQGLPRWEQIVFMAVNLPFSFATSILGLLLAVPFQLMIILQLPFLLFAMAGSLVWFLCLGVILGLSLVSERVPLLRPVTFMLALPFLIIGHNLNGLTPAPTPGDVQAKIQKWDLVEAFPFTWSLSRFFLSQGASDQLAAKHE